MVARRIKDPTRWAEQQINNAKSGSADWLSGVNNPSRDPIEAAKAAADKYYNAMDKVKSERKFEKGFEGVTSDVIKQVANRVGTAAYEQGIDARAEKIRDRINKLHPQIQAVSNSVQSMSDKTDADREKRMVENLRMMRKVHV